MKFSINLRRALAYILDILIVTFVASLVGKTFLNPLNKDYEEISLKYQEEYNNYSKILGELSDLHKTDSFNKEKLGVVLEKYLINFKDVSKKEEITRDDYEDISQSVDIIYLEKLNDYAYEMDKTSVYFSIFNIVSILLYFVLMEFFMNGQTLGKKICNLQVVYIKEDKKIGLLNLVLRNIILYNILATIISLVLIFSLKKNSYMEVNSIVRLGFSFIELVNYGFILFSKEKRGIHDYVAQTKVVECKKEA